MKIHFIGIGGIGISALAQYYLAKGFEVSGSDLVSSEITDNLKKMGAKIFIGKHKLRNVPNDVEMIIYSPAISKDNPELKQTNKIQILSYPQALGELTKQYFTIAISGTHGKSTTTAMIALILIKAGLNPTVILGTKLKEFGNSNFRMGGLPMSHFIPSLISVKFPILVIEADEHFGSFLNYWPKIIVLTRLEADHLDYFKNFKNYISVFKKFVSHLPKDGILIANQDDKNICNTFLTAVKNVLSYTRGQKEMKRLKKILRIPGEHNVSNSLAALTVARVLKIPDKISFKALSEYKGSWRRFEEHNFKTKNLKFKIIHDYAHHPTEIRATLMAAREKYPQKKIWLIYQPHQYQRTYYLFEDFVKIFKQAIEKNWIQKLILIDIYEVVGREEIAIKKRVSSEKLVKKIKSSNSRIKNSILYLPTIKKTINYLKKNLKGREVVILMGAGDIYQHSLDNLF